MSTRAENIKAAVAALDDAKSNCARGLLVGAESALRRVALYLRAAQLGNELVAELDGLDLLSGDVDRFRQRLVSRLRAA